MRWARSGVAFHEMAVVYRQSEPYRALLEAAFREAGIATYLHEGTPLTERPLGRRIAALLDLVDGDLERATVMTFLADARLPAETWERYGRVSPAGWDTDSRRAGVVRGAEQWERRLAAARGRARGALRARIRRRGCPSGWRASTRCEPSSPISMPAAEPPRARELAGAPGVAARAADDVRRRRRRRSSTRSTASRRSTRSRTRCRSSASARRSPPRSRACAPPTCSTRGPARSASAAWRCSTPTPCAISGSRPWRSSAIAERRFPPPPRQDALLLDHERAELNARHGLVAAAARGWAAIPSRCSSRSRIAAADQALQLSVPRTQDGETRPVLPSTFLLDAAARVAGRPVRVGDFERVAAEHGQARPRRPADGRARRRRADRGRATCGRCSRTDRRSALALLRRRLPRYDRVRAAEDAHWTPVYGPHDGVLSAAGARAARRATRRSRGRSRRRPSRRTRSARSGSS